MAYVQPGRPQGPLPPVVQTKQSGAPYGPAQGLVQSTEEMGFPRSSTTLYVHPLVVEPLASTSLHLRASSLLGVQGENSTVK